MPAPADLPPALARAIADPPPVPDVRSASPLDGLARRTVRPLDLLGHSVAVVAPSVSALTMPFVILHVVGPGAWLSAVVGFGLAFATSLVFNQFATRVAAPGSLYTWVTRGIGPAPGLLVASLMLLGYGTLISFGVAQTVRRGSDAMVSAGLAEPDAGTLVGFACATVLLCVWISVRGVGLSTRVALVSESVLLLSLVCLVVVTMVREHGHLGVDLGLDGADPTRVLVGAGMILAITVGFESSAALSAETERPFLTLPRVFGGTVATCAVLFGLAYVAASATMAATGDLARGPAQRWFPADVDVHRADAVLSVVLGIGYVTLALCALNALARLVFSLAREGLLPAWLGRTHARWRSPWGALLIAAPVAAAPPTVSAIVGRPVGELTTTLLGSVVVVMGIAQVLVAAAVPLFLRKLDEWTWGPVVLSIGTALALVVVLTAYAVQRLPGGVVLSGGLALGALVAGAVWYVAARHHRPEALARMGLHDETVASDLLSR